MRGIAQLLKDVLGKEKVCDDPAVVSLYIREASGLSSKELPLAVVFPESAKDVSVLLSYAYKHDIKVFPVGSSTSLSGSAIPINKGIVLSTERMRSLKEIRIVDSIVRAEPGLRIDELNLVLAKHGHMFPVDPASSSVATIGGAINTGAGGMRGAKYGTMRDWVLGLEIVLPDEKGTIMRIGCRTLKCRQGYDLVRLIVGSEGTLAVVTEAYLRITPLPEATPTILAFFDNLEDLINAVQDIKERAIQPLLMEFLDAKTVSKASEFVNTPIRASGNMLLVTVDTAREAANRVREEISSIMREHGASRIYTASSLEEATEKGFLALRKSLFPVQIALSRQILGKNKVQVLIEDIAVPPSRLVEAVNGIRMLEEKYGLQTIMGGHIGDGNLHPAVGFDPYDKAQVKKVHEWATELMRLAIRLGGTISAEHGIGLLKKEGLVMELEANNAVKALEIMRKIKEAFDPKNILNPGKVI